MWIGYNVEIFIGNLWKTCDDQLENLDIRDNFFSAASFVFNLTSAEFTVQCKLYRKHYLSNRYECLSNMYIFYYIFTDCLENYLFPDWSTVTR